MTIEEIYRFQLSSDFENKVAGFRIFTLIVQFNNLISLLGERETNLDEQRLRHEAELSKAQSTILPHFNQASH